MIVLLKRRIQWRMTNDFSHLVRIGKRSYCNGSIYSCSKNLEGIAKKSRVCGRPKLKGNMLALRRPQNGWERTRILGSDLSGEVRNQKKLHSRRSLQSLLNAVPLLECSNRVHCSDGDNSVSIGPLQVSEPYHTDDWNQDKSFALSRSRDLELAENTVDCSEYFKTALVKKDWETLARTCNGVPRGPARENHWSEVLRRVQKCDPNAYNDIIKTSASQSGSVPEPSFYSNSEAVKTLKASEIKRGFPMSARKNKLCFSPATMRISKMPSSIRKNNVRKSINGRFHKAGGAPQTSSVIGSRSSLTSFKAAGLKQLYPSLLRRSQTRFRWHPSEGRRPDRVSPGSVLHLGYRRAAWGAKRDEAAIFLQAQWRMCLARRSYQRVQRATLSIQRQWRETRGLPSHVNATLDVIEKETSVGGLMESDICSQANEPHELSVEKSAASTQCKELTGKDNQRSPKMPGLSVERLYDSSISAIQEDEIFDEFLCFLPCNELSSVNVLSSPTRNGKDKLLRPHSLEERSVETSHSPVLPETCVELAEDDDIIRQSSTSTKTWNYDMCNLDSPACSPAKELTFARISIDGSLPPTPIKDWSSRKQDPMKRSSTVPVVWNPSSALDVVEPHPSPTKDWASPLTRGRKPPLVLRGSPDAELERERFQLPSEWFMDLDELDTSESCRDTSKVTSISFSPPPDPHLKSLNRCPSADGEMMVPSPRALICIPEESAHNVSPTHEIRNCSLIANSAVIEKSPISVKLTADSSVKTVDNWRWRGPNFSDENVDGSSLSTSANVPTETTDSRSDCTLSSAMEEELLDELTKLFQGSPDPAVCPSDISSSLAGHLSSANDLRCSDSLRSSNPNPLSRVCSGTLGKEVFSGSSARKLNFNFEDEDRPADENENQEVSGSNQELCHHDGEHQMPVKNSERMLVQGGSSLSLLSMLPNFTLSQPAICASQGSDKKFDGHDQEHHQIFEEVDNVRASRASRSSSKRCQSTVTDFLQLVENNLATSRGDAQYSPERCIKRSSPLPQSPEPQLPRLEDEDGFCDKAVDGNVVAVKDTAYQVRDLLPGPFHASIGWEAASATDSPNGFFGPSIECAALDNLDTSFTRRVSTFVTPKMQRSSTAITRSCGAINKTKPPLPVKCRRISFDQINYKFNEHLTPADEMRPLLPENKVSDRLLHSSPVSPDTPLTSFTASSGYLLRSSALSVSKKYFLQSPSSRMQSGKCDSDTESVVSPASSNSAKKESSLEGVEKKTSAKHARALFTCQKTSEDGILKSASLPTWNDVYRFSCFENNYEAMLKHRDTHRLWFPDTLSGPLLLTSGAESDCSFRKSTSSAWDCGLMTLMTDGGFANVENISPSLHDLCKVWEEESMDLVTRSLKYKSLMTDPDLLRQELEVAFEKNEPSSPQTVAWEIQNIERLKEKLESRERLNELVRQQRDTIYINIATNASMRERYRLYSKWGIRRMSRGRLRKVIYELLWKDPKRYHASADLVLQYL